MKSLHAIKEYCSDQPITLYLPRQVYSVTQKQSSELVASQFFLRPQKTIKYVDILVWKPMKGFPLRGYHLGKYKQIAFDRKLFGERRIAAIHTPRLRDDFAYFVNAVLITRSFDSLQHSLRRYFRWRWRLKFTETSVNWLRSATMTWTNESEEVHLLGYEKYIYLCFRIFNSCLNEVIFVC